MKMYSTRFGDIEIDDNSIITFPYGLPGFSDLLKFTIISCDQTEPIRWLQSIDNEDVSIPIINPFIIKGDYEIEVNDDELDVINTHSEEDMIVLNIMVLPEELDKMTVNLMAPLLINVKEMLGTQIMMDYKPIPIKYPAYDSLMTYYKNILTEEVGQNAGSDAKGK